MRRLGCSRNREFEHNLFIIVDFMVLQRKCPSDISDETQMLRLLVDNINKLYELYIVVISVR